MLRCCSFDEGIPKPTGMIQIYNLVTIHILTFQTSFLIVLWQVCSRSIVSCFCSVLYGRRRASILLLLKPQKWSFWTWNVKIRFLSTKGKDGGVIFDHKQFDFVLFSRYMSGADPGFQVKGGALKKKLRRAEGGAKIFGVFRVKNHDFTTKKSCFFQF